MGFFDLFSSKTTVQLTRVIFFGDSITEAAVYAGGYIAQMQALLSSRPGNNYELLGAGIGGNKVYDLYFRLENDVLEKKPHTVFLYVGVNDVWHKKLAGTGTDPDKFQQFYAALIRKIQATGSRVIVCTPACIGEKTNRSNPLDDDLDQYAEIIRSLAKQFGTGLCDLRRAFVEYEAVHNPANADLGILTTDGVHLNETGNQLVATIMLRELE